MQAMDTEEEQIVAILHDVVEKSPVTLAKLKSLGYPDNIVQAVDCLSKREGEDYFAYIERVKGSELAVKVKLADLNDNLDPDRIPAESEIRKEERISGYHRAIKILKNI